MKIICIGRNYPEHARELNNEIPKNPVIFIKPDTAILKGNDFYIPDFSEKIHYELELVVKISKGGKYILKENASKHYEEIGLGIDFTARDIQDGLKEKGLPWELAKGFDGSAMVSSFFPKKDLPLNDLSFSLEKNNNIVQEGNTRQMLFGIDDIIAFASQYFTLRVGDLIFTGTPPGVGEVAEGDVLVAYLQKERVFKLYIH